MTNPIDIVANAIHAARDIPQIRNNPRNDLGDRQLAEILTTLGHGDA